MKHFHLLKFLCLFSFGISFLPVAAQTLSIYSLNPVCNHDGVLVVNLGGSGGGSLFVYQWSTEQGTITHITMDVVDTLFNFGGGTVNLFVEMNGAPVGWGADYFDYPLGVSITAANDTCPLQTGAISLAVTGGVLPYTYNWTLNGLPYGGNTPSLTNLSGGEYDCQIIDGAGCQMNAGEMLPDSSVNGVPITGLIIESINNLVPSISSTPANCTNGTATISVTGGTAPYSYLWSNNQTTQTATGLLAWSVAAVTVTDANGCFAWSGTQVTSNVTININESITNAHCTLNDGAITVIPTGGTGPYSYLWNTLAVTPTITNIPSGSYMVTVIDAQACEGHTSVYVNSITPVNSYYITNPSQCNAPTGSATLAVNGGIAPYTYEWYTIPVQTTATATNLSAGLYNYKVTDTQGCISTGTITIPQNTTLSMNISTTASVCIQNNGTATMNASGGIPPLNYIWSTSQTTSSINNLSPGLVFGTVADSQGCIITDCKNVDSQTQLYLILIPQIASCLYTADGGITVNITNGTPPYTYQWSNGQTTSSISGLLTGYYSLSVTDALGCTYNESIFVGYSSVNPCTSTITGRVYIDINNDCISDPGEPGMENIPIKCITTNEIDFTDPSGYYSFLVPAGIATIEQLPVPYRYQSCPAANPFTVNVPATGLTITQNIADSVDWVNDLTIGLWCLTPPVVGTSFVQRVVEFNRGTQAILSTNQYDYSTQTPFQFSTVPPSTYTPAISQATWDNAFALPLNKKTYNVTHLVPASVPINTQLYFTDTIFPVVGDTTWWDNNILNIVSTVGPFDPNYKEVTPSGTGPQGFISQSDSVLEYVVHFQNIGNYFAQNVRVLDQLDSDLEPSSLRVMYSTHNHTTHISASGEIEFYFHNIYLPSIEDDSIASNGFVVYTIHLKPNLANGTQIENNADIYFDFNAPITTNTTVNTIQLTGIEEYPSTSSIFVYPNPNSGTFTINFSNEIKGNVEIELYNATGQSILHSEKNTADGTSIQIAVENLVTGIYLLQVRTRDAVYHKKVMIRN